jgi:hypothetical protein
MGIPLRSAVAALAIACAPALSAQSFVSQINGIWEGVYCGANTTTFRVSTRAPQRSWVTEHWCNGFGCGDLDYTITQVDPAARQFTVQAIEGTGFMSRAFSIRYEVAADGASMTGTYIGHARCRDNRLTKVSADAGEGPQFAGSVGPLPTPGRARVAASGLPSDVRASPMADEAGSTECLVTGSRLYEKDIVDQRGEILRTYRDSETRWVYNRCRRDVGYALVVSDSWGTSGTKPRETILPGVTHVWQCFYSTGENPFGMIITRMTDCQRR